VDEACQLLYGRMRPRKPTSAARPHAGLFSTSRDLSASVVHVPPGIHSENVAHVGARLNDGCSVDCEDEGTEENSKVRKSEHVAG
jgi:hypothetical protein